MKKHRPVFVSALVLVSALCAYAGDVRISALVEESSPIKSFWELLVTWLS